MNQKFELVSPEYYSEELKYQDRIDGNNNANRMGPVEIHQRSDRIEIQFPKEQSGLHIVGEAWFYSPGNSKRDKKIPLRVDTAGLMIIEKHAIESGVYQFQLTWTADGKKFYKEQNISIQ